MVKIILLKIACIYLLCSLISYEGVSLSSTLTCLVPFAIINLQGTSKHAAYCSWSEKKSTAKIKMSPSQAYQGKSLDLLVVYS